MGLPILILVDYRRAFWSSTRNLGTICSLDVAALCREFRALGHDVEVCEFADLDLSREDLRGRPVIYTSSEDAEGHYKRYIEAKVFGLRLAGAHPIPEPELLLAHHDKVMMESVRHALLGAAPGQLESFTYGTFEEYQARLRAWADNPVVVKPAQGAGARGVTLVRGTREAVAAGRRISRSFHLREEIGEYVRRCRSRGYVHRSRHRRSIVVQRYVPGLTGDYKVLRYGDCYYVVARANRPHDFRASGSGRLDYRPHERVDVKPVLDVAAAWSEAIGSPFCSLDVARVDGSATDCYLIEFQCVNFGPAAAENSSCCYRRTADGWERTDERCDLERVFARAASEHVRRA